MGGSGRLYLKEMYHLRKQLDWISMKEQHPGLSVCMLTQSCLTLQPHGLWPTRLFCPWTFSRILEQVAISHSRGSSWPRDRTSVSYIGRWILYPCVTWDVFRSSQRKQWEMSVTCVANRFHHILATNPDGSVLDSGGNLLRWIMKQ